MSKKSTCTIPLSPANNCDIVMKGGITSGVVYPLALFKLAEKYRFKNIGGTSAGAIAAAVAAAAEYDRIKNQSTTGFEEMVQNLPEALTHPLDEKGNTPLFNFFQPNEPTKPVYDVLKAFLSHTKKEEKKSKIVFDVIGAILKNQALFLSALPNLIFFFTVPFAAILLCLGVASMFLTWSIPALSALSMIALGLSALCLWVVAVGLFVVAVLIGFAFYAVKSVAENGFGLCKGLIRNREGTLPKPLTEWLADYIDETAGKKDGNPLTFGDLWDAEPLIGPKPKDHRDINLQMFTTNLTFGRPHQLPFTKDIFLFDEDEFRTYFPKRIVDYMTADKTLKKTYTVKKSGDEESGEKKEFYKLPAMEKLPIVVAARMSLSFPVLISAVPLYAIDYSLKANRNKPEVDVEYDSEENKLDPEQDRLCEKCWFSDGGICSNFPVHFFDCPIPKWPTFAINLSPPHPDHPNDKIWLPKRNNEGISEAWNRKLETSTPYSRFVAFCFAIIETMQNWSDNTQMKIPGYRDRIAHVLLDPKHEGGLNLNMKKETITDLTERGELAATKLIERFLESLPDTDTVLTWQNHQWVRYRNTMSLLEEALESLTKRTADARLYGNILTPESEASQKTKHGYTVSKADMEFMQRRTQQLEALMTAWNADMVRSNYKFQDEAPKPEPELRVKPKM